MPEPDAVLAAARAAAGERVLDDLVVDLLGGRMLAASAGSTQKQRRGSCRRRRGRRCAPRSRAPRRFRARGATAPGAPRAARTTSVALNLRPGGACGSAKSAWWRASQSCVARSSSRSTPRTSAALLRRELARGLDLALRRRPRSRRTRGTGSAPPRSGPLVLVDARDRLCVEQLDARERDARADERDGGPARRVEVREGGARGDDVLRDAVQAQRQLGDDAERPLRADEEAA